MVGTRLERYWIRTIPGVYIKLRTSCRRSRSTWTALAPTVTISTFDQLSKAPGGCASNAFGRVFTLPLSQQSLLCPAIRLANKRTPKLSGLKQKYDNIPTEISKKLRANDVLAGKYKGTTVNKNHGYRSLLQLLLSISHKKNLSASEMNSYSKRIRS